MTEDFDIGAAVDAIGADLGLGGSASAAVDNLGDGTKPAEIQVASPSPAPAPSPTPAPPELDPALETDPLSPEAQAAADAAAEAAKQVQSAADNAAPRTWRAEAAAAWATLPPVAQQEILKREQDMWKGLEGYKADAAYGKGFKQVIQPYEGILQQHGIDPVKQVNNLMQAHFTLATGTEQQKLELFQRLASDYGVDLINAATAIPPFVDPQVAVLQKKFDLLESNQTAQQAAAAKEARVKFESEIDAFAADKGNVYFEELVDDIASLLNSGRSRSLKEAYEAAIWGNPTVRAKELVRLQAVRDSEVVKQRQVQTINARKASSANVKAIAKSGSAAAPLGSIDDTLNETLAAIRGRV